MTTKTVNPETKVVLFKFDDGSEATFDLSQVSPEILTRLALHGASQKIGDSYAGAKDETDPVAYAKESVADVIAQLYKGEWRATATGSAGPRVTNLAMALVRAGAQPDVQAAATLIDGLDDDEKKALRKVPKVKAALAAIEAEKAAAKAQKLAEEAAKAA